MCSGIRLNLYYAANSISHSLHYAFHPISILKSIFFTLQNCCGSCISQLVINSGLYVHSLQLDYITTECILYQNVSLSVRELVQTCSWIVVTPQFRRTEQQGKKDQQPSSNSGPVLYRKVSATRATNPSRDPPSPIAL